jgi:epoxyqueuosine reductase
MRFFKRYKKFIAFSTCGVLTFLVSFVSYWLFANVILDNLLHGGILTIISNTLAEILAITFAFVTSKLFVFESKSFRFLVFISEAGSFALARAGTSLLNTGLMWLFVDICNFKKYELLIKVLVNAIIVVLNFVLSEFLVFRKKHVHHFARILMNEGVEYYACIPLSKCKLTKPYLLFKNGIEKDANVIVMLFPYRTKVKSENLTAYASVKDYHAYVESLSRKLERYILRKHPTAQFKVFADHSPIDEVHAACVSGLGFMGDNGLLINEKYSSFVFVGECITNLTPKQLGLSYADEEEMRTCLHCGKCKDACPSGCIQMDESGNDASNKKICLSAITQKKGELSEDEKALMLKHGSLWGCDVCQNICPYTKNAKYTPIKYFIDSALPVLDNETLRKMSDEEFSSRPFAWRGRETISRNVQIWEAAKAPGEQKSQGEAKSNKESVDNNEAINDN